MVSCLASRSGTKSDSFAIDYQATLNCLEAAKKQGANHFVMLSAFCVKKPILQVIYFQKDEGGCLLGYLAVITKPLSVCSQARCPQSSKKKLSQDPVAAGWFTTSCCRPSGTLMSSTSRSTSSVRRRPALPRIVGIFSGYFSYLRPSEHAIEETCSVALCFGLTPVRTAEVPPGR